MYILTRYVVWEVLKYFLAALVALTLVVTPVMGIKEGLNQGFPATVMLKVMPFMLPEMLGLTIPASLLFSVCSVFGRMTEANEVVALKSLGISPMAVVWPALVLSAFLSLGTVWMYEIAATWCKPNVLRIGAESIEQIVYSMLRKNGSCERDQFPFSITVKRVDDPAKEGESPRLIQPRITIKGPSKITISAAEAVLSTDWDTRKLRIDVRQGTFDVEGGVRMSFLDWEDYSVPIPEPGLDRHHRDYVALRDIPNLITELEGRIAECQATLQQFEEFREANEILGVPEPPEDAKKIAATVDEIDNCRFKIRRLRTEPYRRWANGFTCLCFAMIGIPVAMLWRHADVLTNFFACFLPILAVYYPLLMLSDGLATSGTLWPVSFWTANVGLAIPAVFLLRRIIRH